MDSFSLQSLQTHSDDASEAASESISVEIVISSKFVTSKLETSGSVIMDRQLGSCKRILKKSDAIGPKQFEVES